MASANTLTIPQNSSVAFATGTVIEFAQYGAGITTITPGAGVTLRSRAAAYRTAGQYARGAMEQVATNEWYVYGDLIV